jgi:hypothetical protein
VRPITNKIYYDVFAVCEKLYCFWDCNSPEINRRFIKGVDSQYFCYLADVHSASLEGENKLRAAIALHTAYYHGVETLFTLIFAGLHAPSAMPAWILKCKSEDLRTMLTMVKSKQPISNTTIQLEEYSWEYIASFFNGVALIGNERQDDAAKEFGELWKLFADDFLDGFQVGAYNSFKHGFRIKMGGMKVEFAPDKGTKPLPEEFISLGDSKYGTTFYLSKKINGAPNAQSDQHFRITENHVNSYPEYMVDALRLISISIFNVVECMKRFSLNERPQGKTLPVGNWFDDLRRKRTGLTNFSADADVSEGNIKRFNKQELQKELDSRKGQLKIQTESK